jgi:hypothetical protein
MVAAILLIAVRIGVGFHYPSDMLAGAAIGMLFAWVAMRLFDRSARVHRLAVAFAAGFERMPHAVGLYGLLAVAALEFAMHFSHVMRFIMWLVHALA